MPGRGPKSSAVKRYLVSSSGQVSLPANVRHRWKLEGGGSVDVLDLGFGVLTVPVGTGSRLFRDILSQEEQAKFVGRLGDEDLATT